MPSDRKKIVVSVVGNRILVDEQKVEKKGKIMEGSGG